MNILTAIIIFLIGIFIMIYTHKCMIKWQNEDVGSANINTTPFPGVSDAEELKQIRSNENVKAFIKKHGTIGIPKQKKND